jgi:DNA-binding GntR family transcriptional regulator
MSDRIRAVLEERIIDGTLKPGDRLVELNLAKEFTTSQTPVREALRALESQRLIESMPYKGTYVRAISDREMEESYAVRGALEQLAAELAAPYFQSNVAGLRATLVELHAAARRSDLGGYSRCNFAFHRDIVLGAQNQLLTDAWQALNFDTRVRVLLARLPVPKLVERAGEHDPIVDALEVGDGTTAGRLLREHANHCLKRWKERHASLNATEGTEASAPVPANCLS